VVHHELRREHGPHAEQGLGDRLQDHALPRYLPDQRVSLEKDLDRVPVLVVVAYVSLEHRSGNAHRCLLLRPDEVNGPDRDGESEH